MRRGGHDLEAAAREAASRWRYEPPTPDGEPVDLRVSVTMEFPVDR